MDFMSQTVRLPVCEFPTPIKNHRIDSSCLTANPFIPIQSFLSQRR